MSEKINILSEVRIGVFSGSPVRPQVEAGSVQTSGTCPDVARWGGRCSGLTGLSEQS